MPILKIRTISGEEHVVNETEMLVYIHPKTKQKIKVQHPDFKKEFDLDQLFLKDYVQSTLGHFIITSKIESFWFE